MSAPATSPSPESAPRRSRLAQLLLEYAGPLVALVMIVGALLIWVPSFRSTENFQNIGRQIAVVAILAVGETLVIVTAGIDLSVGSLVALTGVLSALSMRGMLGGGASEAEVIPGWTVPLGFLVGLASGALVGALSGVIIERLTIPAFIVTLGMLGICAGSAKLASHGQTVGDLPDAIKDLGAADIAGGIPIIALIMLGVVAGGQFLLTRTAFGRALYAIGGNREAARLSGIPVRRVSIACFALCGMLSGLAGMVSMARTGSAQPTAGEGYELQAVAAAVIGGTSLMGGEGSVVGALIGALIMGVLSTGLDHIGLSSFIQQVAIGGMIVIAVLVDRARRSLGR